MYSRLELTMNAIYSNNPHQLADCRLIFIKQIRIIILIMVAVFFQCCSIVAKADIIYFLSKVPKYKVEKRQHTTKCSTFANGFKKDANP